MGEQQVTQRPLDAETGNRLHLGLPAGVTQLRSGLADFLGLYAGHWEGSVEHDPRRAIVAIHMRRRERQLRTDALKTVPERVFIQLP